MTPATSDYIHRSYTFSPFHFRSLSFLSCCSFSFNTAWTFVSAATKFMRHILARFSTSPPTRLQRFSLVANCSRHVRVAASNSRKTNYKWRTATRLLDSRDVLVTGLASFPTRSFDIRPAPVTRYYCWISSDTHACMMPVDVHRIYIHMYIVAR